MQNKNPLHISSRSVCLLCTGKIRPNGTRKCVLLFPLSLSDGTRCRLQTCFHCDWVSEAASVHVSIVTVFKSETVKTTCCAGRHMFIYTEVGPVRHTDLNQQTRTIPKPLWRVSWLKHFCLWLFTLTADTTTSVVLTPWYDLCGWLGIKLQLSAYHLCSLTWGSLHTMVHRLALCKSVQWPKELQLHCFGRHVIDS